MGRSDYPTISLPGVRTSDTLWEHQTPPFGVKRRYPHDYTADLDSPNQPA